jgi:2,5-dihydroxypyridine 5,6-dioxygenase
MSEIYHASLKLVRDMMKVRQGETVVVTTDSEGDLDFALSVERAVKEVRAKSLIVRNWAPPHVGRAAEPYLPVEVLKSVVSLSDVWIELNAKWLLYSSIYEEALRAGRTRYVCLVGMSQDMAVRCIGRVDVETLLEFQKILQRLTSNARSMHYTTPRGTDVVFENDPRRPVISEGDVKGPGEYMLIGQVDWAPIEETIEGTIVFDGSVNPPTQLGLLANPIKLKVKAGRVVDVLGGYEAKVYSDWLRSLGDQNMYCLAHVSYGCNPGARLTGNVLEDERVWGCLEWGLGNQSEGFKAKNIVAVSHSDGITLNPTLYADGQLVIKDGEYVHPELKELAKRLRPSK